MNKAGTKCQEGIIITNFALQLQLTIGTVFLSVILDLAGRETPLIVHPEVGDALVGRLLEPVLHDDGALRLVSGNLYQSQIRQTDFISEIIQA